MKNIKLIAGSLLFTTSIFINAQTQQEITEIQKQTNVSELTSLSQMYKIQAEEKKKRALTIAKQKGWKQFIINKNGSRDELMDISEDEKSPVYYTVENYYAAKSTRTNFLNSGGGLGLELDGQGMTAYVWDGGPVRTTHQDFQGRVMINDGVPLIGGWNMNTNHATHVTGTIAAAGGMYTGANPDAAKGMANKSNVKTHEWNNDLAEAAIAAGSGMLLSNHSYGLLASSVPVWYFGAYLQVSKDWDELMYNSPYYLMVKAAGNDGISTANTNPVGGFTNYDKLLGMATAKNNVVVANAKIANIDANGNLLPFLDPSGYLPSETSQGPTDDLRIKPDIAGNGMLLISPFGDQDYTYGQMSGTSMAAPNVTGTLLLLQQHYKNLNPNFMRAATLKGLALHTADDIGYVGPDAISGWGYLNAKFAAETITKRNTFSIIEEKNLVSGGSYSFTVTSDGTNPLKASISWTDPAGTVNSGTINLSTPVLVNDLDIRITKNGITYYPYKLNTVTTWVQADNKVDPFERIDIPNASGEYIVTVTNKGTLQSGSQNYSLIVTGVSLCVPNLTLASSVTGTDNQQASVTITALNTINNGSVAVYHAGTNVLLTNGFASLSGSKFRGYIEGCTGNYVAKQAPKREVVIYDTKDKEIKPVIMNKSIKIASNPNNGIFKVIVENIKEGTAKVTNLNGNLVYEKKFKNEKEIEINIQDNPKGVYLVSIGSDREIISGKVIVK